MTAAPDDPDPWSEEVERLLSDQDGVISRKQLTALGVPPHLIRRMVRGRFWVRILPGVYVNHTGEPTWRQRAWAGVLHYAPAVLTHASAVRAVQGPGWNGRRDDAPIEIAVSAERVVQQLDGYRTVRTRRFDERAQWISRPPRMRFEEAVIDMAAQAPTEVAAIGVLADACQSRRTTAQRLLRGVAGRSRVARRSWLEGVLRDVAEGTCSVLEHAFLARVERPHALPRGTRQPQERTGTRRMYRDVTYDALGFIVELDGRLHHEGSEPRDRDMERDLDAAVDGRASIRLGWGQCVDRPCRTAGKLATILRQHGWNDRPTPCSPDCLLQSEIV